jgi:hypothetical protein
VAGDHQRTTFTVKYYKCSIYIKDTVSSSSFSHRRSLFRGKC